MRLFYYSLIIFLALVLFFSYKLTEVPVGITVDEAAFGYNASLISATGRDENNRFLPAFVLSLDGRDWRQPVAQYGQVLMFKLSGSSLFNLKFVSVLTIAVTGVLIFILGSVLRSKKIGLFALLFFISTPVILIHSHLALDNISPLPFIILWLLGIVLFEKKKDWKFLAVSGAALGIAFYAHKSMRSAAPVWTLLTLIYLLTNLKNWKKPKLKEYKFLIIFLISVLPFYLIAPVLDYKYAGAVFGMQTISANSPYEFIKYYISNFDLSFLFITGDTILHHSTGIHGMFLPAGLPFFIYGIFKSFAEKNEKPRPASRDMVSSHTSYDKFFMFLIVCFFAGPLLLGFIGSIHRASRLLFLVPLFSLISAYGLLKLLDFKNKYLKFGVILFCLILVINFFDFLRYYWFRYGGDSKHIFYQVDNIAVYKKMSETAKSENLNPVFSKDLISEKGDSASVDDFARSLYFINPEFFDDNSELNTGNILLTRDSSRKEEKVESGNKNYFLYIKR